MTTCMLIWNYKRILTVLNSSTGYKQVSDKKAVGVVEVDTEFWVNLRHTVILHIRTSVQDDMNKTLHDQKDKDLSQN